MGIELRQTRAPFNRTRAYIRYSDTNQDHGFSVEYQTSEIKDFAARNGLTIQEFHTDQALSAMKVAGRDEFFALVQAVKDGAVDTIIVYKLNRMFRNALESHKYRKMFREHGVRLMSVTETIDEETSTGRFSTGILSEVAQFQSETTSDFVKSSMREMARQGYFTGGTVPYGYKLEEIEHGTKVRKKFIPHPDEAAVVVELFEMYADNHSLRTLQEYLFDARVLTRQGKKFGKTTIARMLGNDFYIGTLRFKTKGYPEIVTENAFEPIIDLSLWNKVQERKKARKLVQPRKKKDLYALTGIIHCGLCGHHFFGMKSVSTQRGIKYEYKKYVCSESKNYHTCSADRISKEYIEKLVIDEIRKNILNEEDIKRIAIEASEMASVSPSHISREIKRLLKEKGELEKMISELTRSHIRGNLNEDTYRRENAALESELTEVNNAIFAYTEQQRYCVTPESVEHYLYKMLEYTTSENDEFLKILFDNFVENVVIGSSTIDIYLIVRPTGKIAYKETSGHPLIRLYASCLK